MHKYPPVVVAMYSFKQLRFKMMINNFNLGSLNFESDHNVTTICHVYNFIMLIHLY